MRQMVCVKHCPQQGSAVVILPAVVQNFSQHLSNIASAIPTMQRVKSVLRLTWYCFMQKAQPQSGKWNRGDEYGHADAQHT